MNISRKSGVLIYNPDTLPQTGIVFFYADWSESLAYLKHLIKTIDTFHAINLYIYNVDEKPIQDFMKQHSVRTHGVGETFWVHKNTVIAQITNYKKEGQNITTYSQQLSSLHP